jgi:type VI secretion system protein VasI
MRFVFFVLLAVSSTAYSADECTVLSDNQKRLACYDMKYRPVAKTENVGQWKVSSEVSKIDDSSSVFMYVYSDENVDKRIGGSDKAMLTVRCMEHKTSVIINLAGNFLADVGGYGEVTYRLDNQKAVKRSFSASTNNEALGLWSSADSIPVIKSMFDRDTMIVRLTPFNQSAETVTFPIAGLKAAIDPLRKSCKW